MHARDLHVTHELNVMKSGSIAVQKPVVPLITIEEDIHPMLVGERLHGGTHLLKLLVAGVSCVPTPHHTSHHWLVACKQQLHFQ